MFLQEEITLIITLTLAVVAFAMMSVMSTVEFFICMLWILFDNKNIKVIQVLGKTYYIIRNKPGYDKSAKVL